MRVQPMQVRTAGVERMKDVIEQRTAVQFSQLQVGEGQWDALHWCPLGHVALETSLYGTASPHAGQLSSRSFVSWPDENCCPRSVA